jgi:hypothetical protein
MYHTISRDLITNEIFRRVKGQTMGEFLKMSSFKEDILASGADASERVNNFTNSSS